MYAFSLLMRVSQDCIVYVLNAVHMCYPIGWSVCILLLKMVKRIQFAALAGLCLTNSANGKRKYSVYMVHVCVGLLGECKV